VVVHVGMVAPSHLRNQPPTHLAFRTASPCQIRRLPYIPAMHHRNHFFGPHRFVSLATWRDAEGGALVWPACWWASREPVGADVHILGITLGWLRGRVRLDFGRVLPVAQAPWDWQGLGLDATIHLARQRGLIAGRSQMEQAIRHPGLQRLVALGGGRYPYGQLVLLAAMQHHTAARAC